MRELENITTLLTSDRKIIAKCVKELPGKEDFEHLELFAKYTMPELEDKMATILSINLIFVKKILQRMIKQF
jgi:hypothetical protein